VQEKITDWERLLRAAAELQQIIPKAVHYDQDNLLVLPDFRGRQTQERGIARRDTSQPLDDGCHQVDNAAVSIVGQYSA